MVTMNQPTRRRPEWPAGTAGRSSARGNPVADRSSGVVDVGDERSQTEGMPCGIEHDDPAGIRLLLSRHSTALLGVGAKGRQFFRLAHQFEMDDRCPGHCGRR